MNCSLTYLLVFLLLLLRYPLLGQFNGGDYDGFSKEDGGMGSINEQSVYIGGGIADGSYSYGTGLTTLNDQTSYCQGGPYDGVSSTFSNLTNLNNQDFYCSGGSEDGSSIFLVDLTIMNEQGRYCSGGNADGHNSSFKEMTMLNVQVFYCTGGNADGFVPFHLEMVSLNFQPLYCTGGSKDGFSNSLFSGNANDPELYCSGGIEDGWSSSLFQGLMHSLDYCLGGQGDGWHSHGTDMASLNTQNFYCIAGAGDGYDTYYFNGYMQPFFLYCLGGLGDGHQADNSGLQLLGYGIWTGAASNLWSMATNWKCNTVPTIAFNVVIPSGVSFYPLLNESLSINSDQGTYQCKRMDILAGGQLIARDAIIVCGLLNVSGFLHFQKINDNTFSISSQGALSITSGGEVKVE